MTGMALFARALAACAALAAAGAAPAATLDRVRQEKTIRLAVRADAPPFSYRAEGGEPAGFMVDLCRAVATGLAGQLNLDELKVEFVPVTAENRL